MSVAYWAYTQKTDVGQAILRFILPLQLLEAWSHSHRKGKLSINPIYLERGMQ